MTLLPTPTPYDFDETVALLRMGPNDPCCIREPGRLALAWRTADGPATLELRRTVDGVEAASWGPGANAAMAQAPRVAGLHDDPAAFAPDHPVLARLSRVHAGLHLCDSGDIYGALLRATLQQLITWAEACGLWRGLVQTLGEPAPGPLGLGLPPEPKTLANTPLWTLQRIGLPERRANTVRLIGRHHKRLLEARQMTRTDRLRRLQAIPGIGAWTSESVSGLYLGDPDAMPPGDVHLPRHIHFVLTGEDRNVDDRHLMAQVEAYRPHRFRVMRLVYAAKIKPPRRTHKKPFSRRF